MPRHVSLPGANELFKTTAQPVSQGRRPAPDTSTGTPEIAIEAGQVSGRVKHDEKITVYLSSAELLRLEALRLKLRADHGLGVDRGRIVRIAIDAILDEYDRSGGESELVNRLSEEM